jgi:DNA polymerase III epsilon subunit-like protein
MNVLKQIISEQDISIQFVQEQIDQGQIDQGQIDQGQIGQGQVIVGNIGQGQVIVGNIGLSPKIDYNLNQIYDKIRGKKVFIFDLETTGIFDKTHFYKYWDNTIFDSARIVEIGYYYTNNFSLNNDSTDSKNYIHSYLRKPLDFDYINPLAEEKHGLNITYLKTNGIKFSQILNAGLIQNLNDAEYIISHNTQFDFYILLNELHRLKLYQTIQKLLYIMKSKKLLCTCKASGYMALNKLYNKIFNSNPEIAHRAGEDVKTLIEIIIRKQINIIYKNNL